MTHKELVDKAYRWVLNNTRCGVAFKEFHSSACNGECPDVLGFFSFGSSVLVECKASRSDFLSDKKKRFRIKPELGMGKYRFYCCPTGLIKREELPDKWGLIYVNEKGRATCVWNPYNPMGGNIWTDGFEQNIRAEHGLMYSALRRFEVRGMIDTVYQPLEKETV
jgi:hypothetical protein